MSKRFIQLSNDSELVFHMLEKLPNAFLLLSLISLRARRIPGHPDGLEVGDAQIGDWKACGLTRQEYRTALNHLVRMNLVSIKKQILSRQNPTTSSTTRGTIVTLISSDVYDVNINGVNHIINHRPTTDQPLTIKNKKEKEENNTTSASAAALAFFLYQQIKRFKNDYPQPKLDAWAKVIDSMLKSGRLESNIRAVIEWLPTNDFWRKNILSTNSLKKQFDRLEMQMQSDSKPKNGYATNFTQTVKSHFKNGHSYGGYECFLDDRGISFAAGSAQQIFLYGMGFEEKISAFLRARNIPIPGVRKVNDGIELSDQEIKTLLRSN